MDKPTDRSVARLNLEELLQAGYRYACALQTDEGEARALVHEAWLNLTKSYGPEPDLRLLIQSIRNLHIDMYRRSRRVNFSHVDEMGREAGEQIDTSAVFEVPDKQLSQALHALRETEREALFLSVVEGYTAQEIGEITNSPRGTVLSTIHRARIKLRTALEAPSNVVPIRSVNDRSA